MADSPRYPGGPVRGLQSGLRSGSRSGGNTNIVVRRDPVLRDMTRYPPPVVMHLRAARPERAQARVQASICGLGVQSNVRNYQQGLGDSTSQLPEYKEFEKEWLNAPQPWRMDCGHALSGTNFVDVEIEPVP